MTIQDRQSAKQQLRREMRQLIQTHAPDSSAALNAVRQWLSGHDQPLKVALFSAISGEVDLHPLMLAPPLHQWFYPRVSGELLTFHRVNRPDTDLHPGAFGILEPAPTIPHTPTSEIDVFFCPGLAFDSNGGRLGRGRGFYDRTLTSARSDAKKIGICFPFQIVANTFSEPHDVHMHQVIC